MWVWIEDLDPKKKASAVGSLLIVIIALIGPYLSLFKYIDFCLHKNQIAIESTVCDGFTQTDEYDHFDFSMDVSIGKYEIESFETHTLVFQKGKFIGYIRSNFLGTSSRIEKNTEERYFESNSKQTLKFRLSHDRKTPLIWEPLFKELYDGKSEDFTFVSNVICVCFSDGTVVGHLSLDSLDFYYDEFGQIHYDDEEEKSKKDTQPKPATNEEPQNTTSPEEKTDDSGSDLQNWNIGQTVKFGKYETNGDFNTTEDLEWVVVKKEGNQVLLFSKMSLLSMPYGDWSREDYVSWKNSEIRSYLNGAFYYDCFTEDERSRIVTTTNIPSSEEIELGAVQTSDKIFIPSSEEMNRYFYAEDDMRCVSTGNIWGEGTKYGVASSTIDDLNAYCSYWLRDAIANVAYGFPGQCIYKEDTENSNPYSGMSATLSYNDIYYVRACMWIETPFIK